MSTFPQTDSHSWSCRTSILKGATLHRKTDSEQVGIILDRIMGSSDPEVIVDQESNLPATKETVLLLGLLFLQTDYSFEVRIMDDFVQR